MIWLGWRQQRTETLIAAALLALVAVILVPAGIEMAHAYSRDGLSHCLGMTQGPTCGQVVSSFEQRFDKYNAIIGWFNLVPGLFGVALAAPFVLELERCTHRLAWTQSITRRRWVVTKLGLALVTTLLAAAILTAILIWWRQPLVRIDGRMDNGAFDSQGTVILGYALFALGLALAIGALWRRGVPAVMVAFVAYFVARIFVDTWLRQRLLTPHKISFPAQTPQPAVMNHAWVLSNQINAIGRVRAANGFPVGRIHVTYFPASAFWTLQGIETAMFGGLGLALVAFAAWWTLHRE